MVDAHVQIAKVHVDRMIQSVLQSLDQLRHAVQRRQRAVARVDGERAQSCRMRQHGRPQVVDARISGESVRPASTCVTRSVRQKAGEELTVRGYECRYGLFDVPRPMARR